MKLTRESQISKNKHPFKNRQPAMLCDWEFWSPITEPFLGNLSDVPFIQQSLIGRALKGP